MNYRSFEIEDFILDNHFIEWVLLPSKENSNFWENWLLENPDKVDIVNNAKSIVSSMSVNQVRELSVDEINAIKVNVLERNKGNVLTFRTANKRSNNWWLRLAAILTIFTISGVLLFKRIDKKGSVSINQSLVGSIVQKNNTSDPMLLTLSDGTSVILKPNSELSFPKHFTSNKRDVYLKGEAFFEVKRNPQKPFLIYSGEMVTRVLGTSFTIRSFEKDNIFKVIVNTGKVSVYNREDENVNEPLKTKPDVILIPNQQVTYNRDEAEFKKENLIEPLLLSKEISVKLFLFSETPFREVINKLESAYQIDIIYDEKVLGNCPITASLSNQPLLEKLQYICEAIDAKFTVDRGKIIITGNGCELDKKNL